MFKILIIGFSILFSTNLIQAKNTNHDKKISDDVQLVLEVYKSPTCGCCKDWMAHLETNNIKTTTKHPANMAAIKQAKGIAPKFYSCHTGVSKDGFVFEGHIPAKYIHQFIKEKPENAIGLSVPAMPVGSPGMEYKDKFMPYKVFLLKNDGSSEVYADVKTLKDQQ